MNFFTYILQSTVDGRFYIGSTDNITKRVKRHNDGRSTYTKKFKPWNLVWYQQFPTRSEAYRLETKLKKYKSHDRLVQYMTENPCGAGSENLQICDLIDFRDSSKDSGN